jgi:glutamate-1-semialdehyde 2,1-aminomutase
MTMIENDTTRSTFVARTPRSGALASRAERVMPGGDTRVAGYHAPYPLVLDSGEGSKVTDVDGNVYWDLSVNYTSLVHGHGFAPVQKAALAAIAKGTAWPARNIAQIELAEELVGRVESVEHVRFTNSGSEANILAMQIARVYTNRPRVLMARFGYHGCHEWFDQGSYPGFVHVPGADGAYLATYGDAENFEAVLGEHGHEIAAVFIEPVLGSAGIVAAPAEFYQRVRDAATAAGAIVVADEVITFRLASGGHQSVIGIRPDLTTFGKLIGGGFPVGAVGGRSDLMEICDPRKMRLVHSGTFNGNPVTCAAGVVATRELTGERITAMANLGEQLERGLCAAALHHGVPFSIRRVGSLLNVFFTEQPPEAAFVRTDSLLMSEFHLAGMNHGLYFAGRGMLALSTQLTGEDIDDIIIRAEGAMSDIS